PGAERPRRRRLGILGWTPDVRDQRRSGHCAGSRDPTHPGVSCDPVRSMMRYRVESPHPASDNLAIAGPMIVVSVGLYYEAASALLDRGEVPPSAQVPLML